MNTPYGNAQNAYKAYGNIQPQKGMTNPIKNVEHTSNQQTSSNNTQKTYPQTGYNTAQKAYQHSAFATPPEQLVMMLYNGAIKFCNLAFEGFEKKDIQGIHTNIIKVENIILELIGSLDRRYDIAKEYERLYYYIYDLLVEANTHKDIEKLKEAKEFIIWFKEMWSEAITESRKSKKA